MKTRVLTALAGVPVLIAALVIRGWFAEILIVCLTLVGLRECYQALFTAGYKPCVLGGYLAAAVMWPLSLLLGATDPLLLVAAAMGVSMSGVILSKEPSFPDAAASVYPLLACLMPFSMFMMMLNTTYGTVPGVALITMAFCIAYGCDILAYLGGRTFGRHKLCPTVSPKKTVEGAVSGVLGGVLFALGCRALFVHAFNMPMPGIPAAILLGLVGSYAGQIGDLTASLLKRHSGLKDYGKLFPGHGGVMDRFDSVIFTLIVMYCYTLVLH